MDATTVGYADHALVGQHKQRRCRSSALNFPKTCARARVVVAVALAPFPKNWPADEGGPTTRSEAYKVNSPTALRTGACTARRGRAQRC